VFDCDYRIPVLYRCQSFSLHGIGLFLSSFVFYGLQKSITHTKTIFIPALTEGIKAQEYHSKELGAKNYLTNRKGFDRVVLPES
jgi:hypothetical protein